MPRSGTSGSSKSRHIQQRAAKPWLCLSVSLSLSLSDEPSHESRSASTSRWETPGARAQHHLPQRSFRINPLTSNHRTNPGPSRTQVRDHTRRQQDAFKVGPQSPGSLRAAMRIRRTSRHRVSQSLGALASKPAMRFKDQRSHSSNTPFRFPELTRSLCNSWFRRTDKLTLCMWAPHADTYPELPARPRGTKKQHPW